MRPTVLSGGRLLAVLAFSAAVPAMADSFREQIEADWRRQDECRMRQIVEPGLVRFVDAEIPWPGIAAQAATGALRVPHTPGPNIDGRLDDPCWKDAAIAPPGPADEQVQPAFRLLWDGSRLHVGATFPTAAESCFGPPTTAQDACGAVNGVKNGRYGFHTNMEPNPWWQVDLGSRRAIARIVLYNRLDYAPGLHNADRLIILASDNGETWVRVYDNQGKPFGGIQDGRPLVVDFGRGVGVPASAGGGTKRELGKPPEGGTPTGRSPSPLCRASYESRSPPQRPCSCIWTRWKSTVPRIRERTSPWDARPIRAAAAHGPEAVPCSP